MNETQNVDDDVKILPADLSLKKKLGNVNLDHVLSPQTVESAQKIIVQSSAKLLNECAAGIEQLERLERALSGAPERSAELLPEIVAASFSLKSKAGLSGYDLVSTLAKSLHLRCEVYEVSSLTPTDMEIIKWHIASIRKLLDLKVTGSGGAAGEQILAELQKI